LAFFHFNQGSLMNIAPNAVVTLGYRVTNLEGDLIDPGAQPLRYLHGHNGLFAKLEAALEGKTVGDAVEVTLAPEEAFGPHNEDLVFVEPLERLPEGVQVGTQLEARGPEGARLLTVTRIESGHAELDANHPLAGMDLVFSCTVNEVRPASDEELAHGHAHGPEGHEH
jgi:FKBP-type peptidyl-prolyl cis-trans isomerase SlyD